MQKSSKITIGLGLLGIGILLLGTDRIFVSADTAGFISSFNVLTVIALLFFLVGAIWLYKVAFK